jgi:hypothetical protein
MTNSRVVRGPGRWIPGENEWLHHFSWHGAADSTMSIKKVAHGLNFTKVHLYLLLPVVYHYMLIMLVLIMNRFVQYQIKCIMMLKVCVRRMMPI